MLDDTFLKERYKNLDYLIGDKSNLVTNEYLPEIIEFNGSKKGTELFTKHLYSGKFIVMADVDFDGISSAYEIIQFIRLVKSNVGIDIKPCINNKKEHGISNKAVQYFNNFNENYMVIIVDSSSNNIDLIKQIKHDVLVIDHHDITVDESLLEGQTANGEYTVVNCMRPGNKLLSGKELEPDSRYSAGLVVLEFLRFVQYAVKSEFDFVINNKLYQWAASSLFTDVIDTDTARNLYYVNRTFSDRVYENNLADIIYSCNTFHKTLTKSSIGFTIAPLFNKTIRAGKSTIALDYAVNSPKKINALKKYGDIQKQLMQGIDKKATEFVKYVSIDTGQSEIPSSYNGIAASTLEDYFRKTAIAYQVIDGVACGSFRGISPYVLYRDILHKLGYYAEGHSAAFGFKIPLNELDNAMKIVTSHESDEVKEYLTAGTLPFNKRGKYHIDNMKEFQQAGYIWKIGIINSKISGGHGNLNIIVSLNDVVLTQEHEKYFEYDCLGIHCKAFDRLESPEVTMYIEFSDELTIYLRNKW